MTAQLEALQASAEVGTATEADVVDGVPTSWVARPGSTEEVSAVLRAAHQLGLSVVVRGCGSRLDWGAPPDRVDLVLDTGRLDAVLMHAAGDLVVSVQAGVTLAALADVLAPHRQRLALDGAGSVGGTIATAASGPLRYRFGSVRDLLIGSTVVLADGTVTKSGGTVVKNVAGYDLGKLYTGSLGTLGVLTEATFRLHPLPEDARWVSVTTADPARAATAVAEVRNSQNDPVALEVDRPAVGGPCTVCVALEGVTAGLTTRADEVAGLLAEAGEPSIDETVPDWWARAPQDACLVALHVEPAGLAEVLAGAPGAVRGSAGAGTLTVGLPVDALGERLEALRALACRHGGSAVLRRAPAEVKAGVDVWGPVPALNLMRRVKDEFDPEHRLAPGRFVGGI